VWQPPGKLVLFTFFNRRIDCTVSRLDTPSTAADRAWAVSLGPSLALAPDANRLEVDHGGKNSAGELRHGGASRAVEPRLTPVELARDAVAKLRIGSLVAKC
jgi:hypothetical protein